LFLTLRANLLNFRWRLLAPFIFMEACAINLKRLPHRPTDLRQSPLGYNEDG
jgi:hypothetical protein